jgi:quinol monooxygenase YgiN
MPRQDQLDRFVLYEQYADEAAFQAHRHSPNFKENVQNRIVPLLAERQWERYRLVGPGGGPPAPA